MALWVWLLTASVLAGGAFVALLICPRHVQLIALVALAVALTASVQSVVAIGATLGNTRAVGAAILFAFAGASAGYWALSAMLLLLARPDGRRAIEMKPPRDGQGGTTAVVLLSCAEPERYSLRATARSLHRLLATGALQMPAGAVPFVFLAEKARYRQLGDHHPARASARALAEGLEERLRPAVASTVLVALCDGHPSAIDAVTAVADAGYARVAVAVAGAHGALAAAAAIRGAEEALSTTHPDVQLTVAPSVWRLESLALRLCERILETTQGIDIDRVGVGLIAEGQPAQWAAEHGEWVTDETYFLQRVRLLLNERGILAHAVRIGWLEWQTPDVTETVRHLAATGCERVIVVPATAAASTLGTMVDLTHLIASARLPESVHAITLSAWNDDPGMLEALSESVSRAVTAK